jgi:hypothetical protein
MKIILNSLRKIIFLSLCLQSLAYAGGGWDTEKTDLNGNKFEETKYSLIKSAIQNFCIEESQSVKNQDSLNKFLSKTQNGQVSLADIENFKSEHSDSLSPELKECLNQALTK